VFHFNAMTLPVDPKLAKLQILFGCAAAERKATLDADQEARRKEFDARRDLHNYILELGYCPRCELRLSECHGHSQFIQRGPDRRQQPRS
jgi:hypothetical protein